MATSPVLNESNLKDSSARSSRDGSVPSGFILKLFQMVNGAPDDVISWTPNGDGFKIGSDLNKLESETLPQYFRHSRFQSLVRQLNFYNFRKVNRERTFWIYKHDLFHRDRPEDLHLLRRRTCPGVDGRKNRFSSVSSRKVDSIDNGNDAQGSSRSATSEESSVDEAFSGDEGSVNETKRRRRKKKKRSASGRDSSASEYSKRSRRNLDGSYFVKEEDPSQADSSLVSSSNGFRVSHHNREVEIDEQEDSGSERDERTEMIEQSLVVSQVAMKLEEYAKKAKRASGVSLSRGGRARGGVVTPPTGSAFGFRSADSRGLLTYDDEFDGGNAKRGSMSSTTVVTDGDDSLSSEDEPASFGMNVVSESNSPVKRGPGMTVFGSPPVGDLDMVKRVVEKILTSVADSEESVSASAAVIGFCMTTAPSAKDDLCSKVLHLISSSDKLSFEFQQYRGALHPLECSKDMLPPFMFTMSHRKNHAVSVQQIWQRDVGRVDLVRDFKTFAVNNFHEVLLQKSNQVSFTEGEVASLRYAADVWLKSACASS